MTTTIKTSPPTTMPAIKAVSTLLPFVLSVDPSDSGERSLVRPSSGNFWSLLGVSGGFGVHCGVGDGVVETGAETMG